MMTENRDTAGVIAPPPLIALAAVLIGVAQLRSLRHKRKSVQTIECARDHRNF